MAFHLEVIGERTAAADAETVDATTSVQTAELSSGFTCAMDSAWSVWSLYGAFRSRRLLD